MKKSLSVLIIVIGLAVWAVPALAEINANPIVIVVTGTLLPTELAMTPSLIEVIEVDPRNEVSTLGALLDEVAGVDLHQNASAPGGVGTVSIWGSQAAQVLILMDGVPLNSNRDGLYDLSLLPLGAVERIEIQKGSGSSVYGTAAIGGVINIITKKGYQAQNSLSLQMGSYGQQETTLTSQGELFRDTYYALNLGYSLGDGYREHSAYTSGDLYASVSRDLTANSTATVTVLSVDNKTEVPPEAEQESSRLRLQGAYLYEGDDGSYAEAVLWRDSENLGYEDPAYGMVAQHSTRSIGYNIIRSWELPFASLSLASDGRFDRVESTNLDAAQKVTNYGLNAEVSTPLGRGWQGIAAGRLDMHSQFGNNLSPRLGLTKKLAGGLVKLNLGSAFKAPTVNDLYWKEDSFSEGNPNLRPERAWSAEVQYIGDPKGAGQWGVNGFYRRVSDLIFWAPLDPLNLWGKWRPENIAQVEVAGTEISGTYSLRADLVATAFVTVLSAVGTDQAVNPLSPFEYGATFRYTPSPKLSTTLKLSGAGERYNGVGAFSTLDLSLFYRYTPETQIAVSVTNLFDKEYQLNAGYPMPGRQLKAGITCSF